MNLINSPSRMSPVVVVAHDYLDGAPATLERAQRASEQLVGVASVLVLPENVSGRFSELMGADLGILPGEARLYLPGDPPTHWQRVLSPEIVRRHPREIGQRFAQLLRPATVARRAPPIYEVVRRSLRNGSLRSDADLVELLTQELNDQTADLTRSRQATELVESELVDAVSEIESLQAQLRRLRREHTALRMSTTGETEVPTGIPDEVLSVSEAIAAARTHLTRVVIPADAERDVEALDEVIESRTWGQTTWEGLVALECYATTAAQFKGGFWEWCDQSGHPLVWPSTPKKLAMSESGFVLANPRLRHCRILPISAEVDPAGETLMQAHLKISQGGRSLAPRVYFYDDTGGATAKIHIGFIGPHRHMPNKSTG